MATAKKSWLSSLLSSETAISLIISNIIVIIFAVAFGWSLGTALWIYWWQSVIIGFFHFLKLLRQETNSFQPFFFALHYGIFHLVYAVFLSIFALVELTNYLLANVAPQPVGTFDWAPFLIQAGTFFAVIAIFFFNHLFSYMKFLKTQEKVGFADPYYRIFPMHLTIILGMFVIMMGFGSVGVLVLFMLLKTVVDLAMHQKKHAGEKEKARISFSG